MDDFERQLMRAMARMEPPAAFEAKVLAAAARQPGRWSGLMFWFARPVGLRWATVALAALLVTSGVTWQHERERVAGEAARAKLELALKITRGKLEYIDRQIQAVQEGN